MGIEAYPPVNSSASSYLTSSAYAWSTYTPTWTATGGTPSLGNGFIEGRYIKIGSLLHFRFYLLWGSTTSAGTTTLWTFSLPPGITVTSAIENQMPVMAWDTSAGSVALGYAYPPTGTTIIPIFTGTTGRAAYNIPWTWANGDRLQIQGIAEVFA